MAATTSTNMILVISLLCSCLGTLHAQTILTLDMVYPPAGTPYTPEVSVDDKYDIPAGSKVSLTCSIPGTTANLRYPTNVYAKFPRFDIGNRVERPIMGENWTLQDLKHYDTGLLECDKAADAITSETNKSIYIFVSDAGGPLFVPMRVTDQNRSVISVRSHHYIPCLPTHSLTTLTVTHLSSPTPIDVIIDNILGFKLKRRPASIPLYNCNFAYDGRTEIAQWQLNNNNGGVAPVRIILPLNHVYIYLRGETLTLTCTIEGFTNVQATDWSYPALSCADQSSADCHAPLDRVTKTEAVKINGGRDVQSQLTITNLYQSDSGTYTCMYKVNGEVIFKHPVSANITVYPPFAVIILKDVEKEKRALVEETVDLSATVEAIPAPTVVWTFDGNKLRDGARYTLKVQPIPTTIKYKVTLTISSVTLEDAGSYSLAVSAQDSASDVRTIGLMIQEPPSIRVEYTYENQQRILTEITQTVYFQPNNDLELQCRSVHGIPSPTLTWDWQACDPMMHMQCVAQDGEWKLLDPSLVPNSNSTLNNPYFTDSGPDKLRLRVTTTKSGWYRCTSNNGVDPAASTRVLMAVSELPVGYEGIGFGGGAETLAAQLVEGDSLTLSCYVSKFSCAPSDVVITFFKESKSFNNGSKGSSWEDGDNSYILTVNPVDITLDMDGNTYACGCDGKRMGTIKLSVQKYMAPSWSKSVSTDTDITLGETKSFLCVPAGRPIPKVTWYKDNKEIVSDNKTIVLSADNSNLTIHRARTEDAGSYSCMGQTRRNVLPIYSNFTLTVLERNNKLSTGHIAMIVVLVFAFMVIAVIVTVCIVRRYCRKKYTPHTLLLPSKDMINPDIPLDEQTDALPYDIGWEFPFGNLKLGMLLGQGAFGRVLKAEAMNIEEGVSSTTVAVKVVRDHHDIDQVKALISELKILIHIGQHLNIVNLLGACTKDVSKGNILVIVEFCRYGNLRSYLLKHKSNFNPTFDSADGENTAGVKLGQVTVDVTEDDDYLNEGPSELHSADKPVSLKDILSWCYQIARGMEYLASIDYIHRDLAARNVLLADDNIVKICDFGLAKDIYKYQEYQKQTDGPLPIKWMALESLTHKVFNVRTDVWSYGVTVWELFSLAATPYPGWEIDDTFIDKIQDGYRMEIPKHCPDQIYEEVMLNCWHPDAEKRPNFAELAEMMGESVDQAVMERLQSLEDPYIRDRDSRTDITIRPSAVRNRDIRDLESNYLPTKSLQPKANGCKTKAQQHNYYNTSPTASQPNKANKWLKERASDDEKLPLHVAVASDEEEGEIPNIPAPSPSPWERQSHLAKLANKGDDSHSFDSVDSDTVRPPSYNYVMKKREPAADQGASSETQTSQAGPSAGGLLLPTVRGSGSGSGSKSGSKDALNYPPTDQSYIETSC